MDQREALPVQAGQLPAELWQEEIEAEAAKAKREALENYKNFDVHTWSDHPGVNKFVDATYEEHFHGGKKDIKRKV